MNDVAAIALLTAATVSGGYVGKVFVRYAPGALKVYDVAT